LGLDLLAASTKDAPGSWRWKPQPGQISVKDDALSSNSFKERWRARGVRYDFILPTIVLKKFFMRCVLSQGIFYRPV
jgi:hypothetical protein